MSRKIGLGAGTKRLSGCSGRPRMLISSPRRPNVSAANEISLTAAIPLNAPPQIRECVASGRITWTGPLLLVCARPLLLVAPRQSWP